jgi:hypothetical protein
LEDLGSLERLTAKESLQVRENWYRLLYLFRFEPIKSVKQIPQSYPHQYYNFRRQNCLRLSRHENILCGVI